MADFAGRTVIITGAGSGIGRAIALAFAFEGGKIGVLDRDADAAKETVDQIGPNACAAFCDVADEASVASAFQRIENALGAATVLVNNAGVGDRSPFLELDAAAWRRVIDINLTGAFICAHAFVTRLAQSGTTGCLINIASVAGEVAVPNHVAYVASKHGVVGLTKALALDCARIGVRVNAIAPGSVETPLTASLLAHPDAHARIRKTHPLGRWAQPEEIAKLAVFLASDAAAFMTGAIVPIDGGFLAGRPV